MPFTRPTIQLLRDRVKADLMSRLPGTDALLRFNNLGIIGDVEAGIAHLLYGRLEWSFEQLFPDSAEGPFLERWASIWGVNRFPAEAATGRCAFSATPGTSIPAGGIVARRDGEQFTIDQDGFYDAATATITVPVIAVVAGTAGNTAADVQMTMDTAIGGVQPLGVAAAPGIVGGAPEESDELLLQRLLLRIKQPPQGGSASDYVQWALEVPGVTRAWCFPLERGPGTVVVRFMMDVVRASTQGIPNAGDVALVQTHLDYLKPVTAVLTVLAPVQLPVDIVLSGLVVDNDTTRANIQAAMLQFYVDTASPGGELFPNEIVAAINTAPGVQRFRLLSPLVSVQPLTGEIPVHGTITYAAGTLL